MANDPSVSTASPASEVLMAFGIWSTVVSNPFGKYRRIEPVFKKPGSRSGIRGRPDYRPASLEM